MARGEQTQPGEASAPGDIDARIRDAARSSFARHGYAATTMAAIAGAAGVTKPTVYARYASKEELHRDLVEAEGEHLLDYLLRASLSVRGTSFDEAIRAGVHAYFAFFRTNPETYRLLFSAMRAGEAGHMADQVIEQVARRVASIALAIAAHHDVALSPSDARLIAALMLGAGQGAVGMAFMDDDITIERAEALTLEVLTCGLRSAARPGAPPVT